MWIPRTPPAPPGAAAVLVVAALVVVTSRAHAEVDWARGLVLAEGIGVANRAAPSPAAARGPARRLAEDMARKQLLAQLPGLPLAAGGKLSARLDEPAVKAAIDRAVANALVVDAELETDGSWRLTMAVPIEAVRLALAGPRELDASGDAAVPVVVVAGAVKPAVGYRVGKLDAATVFAKQVPAWAKDAPRVKAKGARAGVIDVAPPANASAATLFVIVAK